MLVKNSIKSVETVLDLAVWLEKHGQSFYERAGSEAKDPDIKKLFEALAKEEAKHCAIYSDLYELYTGKSSESDNLLGEYGKFIELLIQEISGVLKFGEISSSEELIQKALQFEKNTLLYFSEVKTLFRGKAGALIEAICREEKKHIQQLMEWRQGALLKRSDP